MIFYLYMDQTNRDKSAAYSIGTLELADNNRCTVNFTK